MISLEAQERETAEQRVYTREEALKNSITYFKGDELAASTWLNKYAMKDKRGRLLEQSPDDMHRRMAKEFARIEVFYKENL
jgi:ribonucleoside-diphosphate reductase alpha chain